jgi:hypothetical protein
MRTTAFGITAALLITGIVLVASSHRNTLAFSSPYYSSQGIFGSNKQYVFGSIDSIQNDKSGKPAWILSGFWKTNLINQSQTNSENASAGAIFNTSFRMIMTNGSGMHTHTITNFVLKNKSMPNKTTTVFNGTASASMREGIVTNIPISIKVMNNSVISIWLDPAKVKNHYGDTPIFGVIFKHDIGAINKGMPMVNKTHMST